MVATPVKPTVLVAGAGAVGSALAHELARNGAKVTVADPRAPGDNASGIAAGMLAPVFESLLDPLAPAFDVLRAARDLWPDLAGMIGLPLDIHGALTLTETDEIDSWVTRLTTLGADFHAVTRRALRECVPWLSSERSALWTTEDWRLSPRDALTALRAGAQSKGARWIEASVTGFEPGRADLSDGGFVDCDALVIATGASGSLCGLAGELNLLTPIKGQILRWPALSLSGPVVRLKGTYICPSPQGVTVGATMEPGRDDLDIDPSAVATLRAGASAVIPALASGPVEARAGVRAATPDGLPLVGPSDRPGVWLAVGARRNGWLLAPLIARIMADMLAGVTPDSRAALFDPARFT